MYPPERYERLMSSDFPDFEVRAFPTPALTAADRATIFALFDVAYREANHAYLEKSLGSLRFITIATSGGTPAGFALSDARLLDLPRLPRTAVSMAGICCIAPEFRRRGLFGLLEGRAMAAAPRIEASRWLSCGRMAHPASMRLMARNPTVVPKPGIEPTAWQQEVGSAIAAAYGNAAFDPKTFVCIGNGTPIGYPAFALEAEPHEWEVFRPVDRDRGDSLLGLIWHPDVPEGWDDA